MILAAPNGVQPLAGIGWAWGWTVFNAPPVPSADVMVCGEVFVNPLVRGLVSVNPLVAGVVEVNSLVSGRVQVSEC